MARNHASIPTLAALALLVTGCASQRSTSSRDQGEPTELMIGDFRAEPGSAGTPGARAQTISNAAAIETESQDPAAQAGDIARPGSTLVQEPEPLDLDASEGRLITLDNGLSFIDAKVGDIAGRPIYISSFFAPIERRLISLAEREDPRAWQGSMAEIVRSRLDAIMWDELLRAETLAALTPENRVGLQAFLENFRDELISQNLGSAQLANQRLIRERGMTLDQTLRQKELDTLVSLSLHDQISSKINVSWRDIKNRYERDIKRFNPPPTMDLLGIRLLDPTEEERRSVTDRLKSGASFEEIAASEINTFNRDTGGRLSTTIETSLEETKFFGSETLNEAIRELDEGDWAGPIETGTSVYWILHERTRQESTSLYEAQLQIKREIEVERSQQEQAAYLQDLMERAKVSSREDILLRLFMIATRLYGPQPPRSP